MDLNWIDIIILAIIAYHVLLGWERGLIHLASNLVSFLTSLWLAIKFHTAVGNFFTEKFGIPSVWADVLGYVGVAILAEGLLLEILGRLVARLPEKFLDLRVNKMAGAVLSAVNAMVIAAFVLVVILALPLRGSAKNDIKSSYFGSRLVRLAEAYGGDITSSLDQATQQAVQFLTVKPSSDERINLQLPTELNLSINRQAESQMLELVNAERAKVGAKPLKIDPEIVEVARRHSRDMFERSYFAHVSPEGHDAGYRLDQGGVDYALAGENLAYAPDVETAHDGLMNSEGHRKNILEPEFGRIGIGVIDGGPYGLMFTQNFAD